MADATQAETAEAEAQTVTEEQTPMTDEQIEAVLKEDLAAVLRGEKTFAQAMRLTGEYLYQVAGMGYKLLQEGNYKDAETIFSGLIELNPKDPNFYMWLGSTQHRKGQIQEAIATYTAALELDAKNATCLANRGELLIVDGKAEDGTRDLMRSIELDPEAKQPSTVRARAILATIAQKLKERGDCP